MHSSSRSSPRHHHVSNSFYFLIACMTDPSTTFCRSLTSQAQRIPDAQTIHLRQKSAPIHRILFVGMGWSWLASKLLIDAFGDSLFIPRSRCQDYHMPEWVNAYTLVIACSYSGTSDETLTAIHEAHERHAHCVCITSWWELLDRAITHDKDRILLPSWYTARRALGWSFVAHAQCLMHYWLGDISLHDRTARWEFLDRHHDEIIIQAQSLAHIINNHTPVIYTPSTMESLGVRARQQLNENSKILSRHHHYPEANHNELMGRTTGGKQFCAISIYDPRNDARNTMRMNLMEERIREQGSHTYQLHLQGTTRYEHVRWGVWVWDRTSLFLAQMNNHDPLRMTWVDNFRRKLSSFVNKKDE